MSRNLFGGGSDDYTADFSGNPIVNRRIRFYTDATQTTEIVDIASDATGTGSPLTVTTNAYGYWGPVYGPDGVTVMYAGAVGVNGAAPIFVVAVYTHTTVSGGSAGVSSFNGRTGAVTPTKADVTGTGLAAADVGAVPSAQLGASNGVATLDGGGKIPTVQLPPLAINDTFTVTSQAAMLALTAQRGDAAVRTDLSPAETFMLTTDDPTQLVNWVQITTSGAVTSVFGRTGAVALTKADITGTGLAAADISADAAGAAAAAQAASLPRLTRTTVKTGAYTAAAGDLVPCDTTSTAFTIILPAAPAAGTPVAVKHIIQGSTNAVTVACGGSDVFNKAGGSTSLTLSLVNQGVLLTYDATTHVWTVVADDLSLSVLDARYDATGAAATVQAASLQKTANLSDVANATTARGNLGAAATSHTHAEADVTSLVTDLAGKATSTHSHAESDVTSLTTDLTARVLKSTWSGKGSILAASAAGTPVDVPASTDGYEFVQDSTQTAGVAWKPRSRTSGKTNTDTTFSNSTATNTVASLAIPTTAVAGDTFHMTIVGEIMNNSGSAVTYTFSVVLGATTVVTSNALSISTSTQTRSFRMDIDVLVVATNDERVSLDAMINGATTGFLLGTGTSSGAGRGTATEDLTAGKNLAVACAMGTAAAAASITVHETFIEAMKA